jgi:antitoxin MazE
MTAIIQRWGNSQGIRIPKVLLETLNVREGEIVDLTTRDGAIIIRATSRRASIAELFVGYEGSVQSDEIDWGKPEGCEVW